MTTAVCNRLKPRVIAFLVLAFTLSMTQPVLAKDASTDGWDPWAELYFWAADLRGKTDGDDVFISLSDILHNLAGVIMASFGANKGKWHLMTDVIYFDLHSGDDTTLIKDKIFSLSLTDVEMKAWVVTPMVGYEVLQTDNLDLNLLVGARYLWLQADFEFEKRFLSVGQKSTDSLSTHAWNGIVGTRGRYTLNEQWHVPFHFDVGTGGSDLTWQAFVGILYETGNWELGGGYRYLKWDFDDGDAFGRVFNSLTVNGPMIAAKYRFLTRNADARFAQVDVCLARNGRIVPGPPITIAAVQGGHADIGGKPVMRGDRIFST